MHKLYILMRTDLESLTPGKACAQAAHAANEFAWRAAAADKGTNHAIWYDEWTKQACGWGTTIVLGAPNAEHMGAITKAATASGLIAGSVIDASYPVRDGEVTHLIPLHTCSYVLLPGDMELTLLRDLELY